MSRKFLCRIADVDGLEQVTGDLNKLFDDASNQVDFFKAKVKKIEKELNEANKEYWKKTHVLLRAKGLIDANEDKDPPALEVDREDNCVYLRAKSDEFNLKDLLKGIT